MGLQAEIREPSERLPDVCFDRIPPVDDFLWSNRVVNRRGVGDHVDVRENPSFQSSSYALIICSCRDLFPCVIGITLVRGSILQVTGGLASRAR